MRPTIPKVLELPRYYVGILYDQKERLFEPILTKGSYLLFVLVLALTLPTDSFCVELSRVIFNEFNLFRILIKTACEKAFGVRVWKIFKKQFRKQKKKFLT